MCAALQTLQCLCPPQSCRHGLLIIIYLPKAAISIAADHDLHDAGCPPLVPCCSQTQARLSRQAS
jgi:hypothetical protein